MPARRGQERFSALAVGTVERRLAGMASGISGLCRQLGIGVGLAFLDAALTSRYNASIHDRAMAWNAPGLTPALSRDKDDTLPVRVINKVMWAFIKELYSDMARMEEVIRTSGLDWTIIRPPKLTNKPPTGHYRTAINRGVRAGYTIGRADLAAAILTLLDDPAAIHAAIGIGY